MLVRMLLRVLLRMVIRMTFGRAFGSALGMAIRNAFSVVVLTFLMSQLFLVDTPLVFADMLVIDSVLQVITVSADASRVSGERTRQQGA